MDSLKWNPWRLYAVKTFVEFPASPRMPSCACSSSKPLSLLPLPHSFGQFDPWMVMESVGSGAAFSALCGRKIQPGGNLFVRFRLRIYFGRVWSRVGLGPQNCSGNSTRRKSNKSTLTWVVFIQVCVFLRLPTSLSTSSISAFLFFLKKNDRCSIRDHLSDTFSAPETTPTFKFSKVMGKAQSFLHCKKMMFSPCF